MIRRTERRSEGLRIERVRREERFSMPSHHFHNHYELYYLAEGSRLYFFNNQVYRIRAGELVVIAPNQIHRTVDEDGGVHERILLELERSVISRVCQTLPGLSFAPLLSLPAVALQMEGERGGPIRRALEEIMEEMGQEGCGEMVFLQVAQLLVRVLRCLQTDRTVCAEESKRHREIYEVAAYIAEHAGTLRSLGELCEHFFISKSHLCREFKKITGLTVQEYITATRIKNARQFLLEGTDTVTQVAERAGYNSITHFERVFKRNVGVSPLAFRNKNR